MIRHISFITFIITLTKIFLTFRKKEKSTQMKAKMTKTTITMRLKNARKEEGEREGRGMGK